MICAGLDCQIQAELPDLTVRQSSIYWMFAHILYRASQAKARDLLEIYQQIFQRVFRVHGKVEPCGEPHFRRWL
jgi:hypothetical protein